MESCFPSEGIAGQMRNRLLAKKQQLEELRPFSASALQRLKDDFAIEWTYNSNSIEGNTLSLRETRVVLQDGLTIGGKSLREHFETHNHHKAIAWLEELVKPNHKLLSRDILHLHAMVMQSIDDEFKGRFRNGRVRITGAISESYGDIFGFLCERHAQPNTWDWVFGEDVSDDYNVFPTREFASPNSHPFDFGGINGFPFFYPSSVGGLNYYNYQLYPTDGAHDFGGIHINCTVQDRCFYLLSMGGTQLGKSVGGIGIDAAAKIAYYALTNYATPNETWELSRLHWITAAEKIFKKCSYESNQTCRAWSAVNVGPYCEPCAIGNRPCYGCNSESTYSSINTIDEEPTSQLRLFPNPASNMLTIEFSELTASQIASFQSKICIYSNIGIKLSEMVISNSELNIDVSQLSPGIYFVHYIGDGKNEIKIFQKQ